MYTLIAFILDSMRNKKEHYLSCNLHTGAPSDFLRVICHSVRRELPCDATYQVLCIASMSGKTLLVLVAGTDE